MYTEHFGFREKPFNTTPDPRIFYTNAVYREAYATVLYGVQERKGFVLLTGEVGTGKTTVLRRAVAELESTARCVLFGSPIPGFDDVLGVVCEELRVPAGEGGLLARLRRLHAWLTREAAEGRTAAVLVDEAQNLDDRALEQLRLLSNLETPREKLLQIVLVGQPELEAKLDRHELRQLRQRIAVRCRLERLRTGREVSAFIQYRLTAAGYRGRTLFAPDVIELVARYSSGLPRLVNVICDNALLATFAAGGTRVAPAAIHEVARDLRLAAEDAAPATPAPAPAVARPAPPRVPAGSRRARRAAWITAAALLATGGAGIAVLAASLEPRAMSSLGALITARGAAPALPYREAAPAGPATPTTPAPAADPAPTAAPATTASPATDPAPPAQRAAAAEAATPAAPAPAPAVAPPAPSAGTDSPATSPRTEPLASPAGDVPPAPAARPGSAGAAPSATPAPAAGGPLVIPAGATVAGLVREHYDGQRLLAMDLIKELNSGIEDLDRIQAGGLIWLPALSDEVLVRPQPDGTFHLIVASVPRDEDARTLARALAQRGYASALTRRPLSPMFALTRVEIVGLRDHDAVELAAHTARRLRAALAEPKSR